MRSGETGTVRWGPGYLGAFCLPALYANRCVLPGCLLIGGVQLWTTQRTPTPGEAAVNPSHSNKHPAHSPPQANSEMRGLDA
ncbi:hypothetical protein SKAU_G00171130 [Synaphobranchus kaupii]|uniref:Uncharacterized protein n=1 Tax=Synaphobranchus kaupii TaxID=118154 RepID=A0A9Q1J0D4_SYNKA|nr:hypothetical protein SKAU_G00171130 [Synaphobranchus kaupii]